MTAAYAKAAIPEPYRILGKRLKPLCLGHYLHMSRFNVAFVAENLLQPTLEDLILGVFICSKTYEEFLAFLDQSDALEQVTAWGKSVGELDFKAKAKLFADYIKEGSAMPAFFHEEDGGRSGAHWTQAVKVILTSELNYTNAEAINAPLTQAFADFFKFCESMGTVRLMTGQEIEAGNADAAIAKEATCPA